MLYFRENEIKKLRDFEKSKKKALAIYGRRRVGKTELVLDYVKNSAEKKWVYFQCTSFDYGACLRDFVTAIKPYFSEDELLDSFQTFKDLFTYINRVSKEKYVFVIDEFPFLCKKNESALVEFQWIIDHSLGGGKIVLLGSNMSFMKNQISNINAPLYGRFDEMIEILPFSFKEVLQLFPKFEDAVSVYSMTGGVALYVMLFKEYSSVNKAIKGLFFERNGRMLQEAGNMLMQEVRDVTSYVAILRAISGSEKDSGQIAKKSGMDARGIFPYLKKLQELGIITTVENPLTSKKREKRYKICDQLFRFNYTFIEPNISMITALGSESVKYVLDEKYNEYLGFVYEDIIRSSCYEYAVSGILPFVPQVVGKWWGNIMKEGEWQESEVDLVAYDDKNIIIGECKYRNKMVGLGELQELKEKAAFIPLKNRKVYFMLAGRKGFTKELYGEEVILIDKV